MSYDRQATADSLRQHATDLLDAAGRADEHDDGDVAMLPDEARKLAAILLMAAELVEASD